MWTWFLPALQVARRWIAEGRIGRIRHIKADFGYPLLPFDESRREYDSTLAGGCLLEMGVYQLRWPGCSSSRSRCLYKSWRGTRRMASRTMSRCCSNMPPARRRWEHLSRQAAELGLCDCWRGSTATSRFPISGAHANACFIDWTNALIISMTVVPRWDSTMRGRRSGADILQAKTESAIVPWSASLKFQDHIERVRSSITFDVEN